MAGEIDPRDLLVSDAEREHVGQLLQRAVGQGRLTVAEFDTRMVAAMAARTRADLNVLVLDIADAAPELLQAKQTLTLRSGMGEIVRRGYWVVPPHITVEGGMGEVKLDFTDAELTSAVTTIEVRLGMGGLTMVVPSGSRVDHDDVTCSMGSVKDRTDRGPGQVGHTYVLRGTCRMGDIKIVHPRSWRLGPLTVHRPFRITWGAPRR